MVEFSRLRKTLERNREEYLKPLKDLVAIDTHCLGHGVEGGLEKEGQAYMARLMKELGAEVEVRQMAEEDIQTALRLYREGNPGHNYDGRENVYGVFPGGGGRSLMFNGHMDTMPAGNVDLWKHPPLGAVVEDGKLYGLGAADMKGGLVAAVMAVKLLKDAGLKLPGDVVITSVADEEGGGNGSIAAAVQGLTADGVVVCEPTGGKLIAAHMGFVFFRVRVGGLATHSGNKWMGVSAIEKAVALMRAIDELEHRWLLRYKHPMLPAPNLNVGTIRGGAAGSTVPGECVFEVCVHYLPAQMTYDQVVEEFTSAIGWAAKGDAWLSQRPPKISVYQAGGAFEMDPLHPFAAAFRRAHEMATGREVEIVGSPAGCDSRVWRNVAGCPTLQFGPGRLEECHAADEYVSLDRYFEAILTYASLILTWCPKI
jgi:acetylornithine deacetylase